ncbi:UDP-N-acetylmuramoyl-L-alanyl-D-glutamate--2,6-diaminopimelate ligase [Rummeliibacillus suwonensis]|uniref:UDP-N-acetylmuramoyl-L-alanyl-D-glutamate--2, 6-diaminopimelate ligase n=1 Tax=Rummeliibacillus suwonensis TaxID=1306154 RepID=UPI0011B3DD00|nr:UDP-N-acetylmuramoyl-L-alanyl-D-glutamate--2,6-diaminopimelate ligase [Rummeliibacillus suwonensis]MBO2534456.1 UDP-N-acetylmuramoyl-L-alanyl-D-glutamate--2,6-diaminopimelate ligase [Rummeliibacillus suwonensis]
MILAELLKEWPCELEYGSIRTEIKGITDRASDVKPGDLYVARKGKKFDGWDYKDLAIQNGAVAIVHNRYEAKVNLQIPVIWVPNCSTFLSYASKKIYGAYDEKLTIVAVTGTNGKTTVTHFIGQLLQSLNTNVAVIGTVGLFINGEKQNIRLEPLTTPLATELYQIFAYCISKGVTHIVMEASSLALSEHRLDDCNINIGVYLNVSRDHYEEHGGEKYYLAAKKRLCLLSEQIIVNIDDPFCKQLRLEYPSVKSFGKSLLADCSIIHEQNIDNGTQLLIQNDDIPTDVLIPFQGEYLQYNVLAAVTAITELGFSLQEIAKHTDTLTLPAGRMQEIPNSLGFRIFIDYAHTPSALEALLNALRLQAKEDLVVVFGCGGDRDQGKRVEMGIIADTYADKIWITDDNPRGESSRAILNSIVKGIHMKPYKIEPNRKKAIQNAINSCKSGDILVIAGKGHEEGQIVAGKILPFSDEKVIKEILSDMKNENK